jgi:hypothetical protein
MAFKTWQPLIILHLYYAEHRKHGVQYYQEFFNHERIWQAYSKNG